MRRRKPGAQEDAEEAAAGREQESQHRALALKGPEYWEGEHRAPTSHKRCRMI